MILPDVLAPNLRVVFCGTAAGPRSAQVRAYYGGPGNYFWETLFKIGLTPRRLQPLEYSQAIEFGIGLTNLAPHVMGLDKILKPRDFDVAGLQAKVEKYTPCVLAFNGKRAAQEFYSKPVSYGLQTRRVGTTVVFVLPSTSGAARGFWNEQYWRELAEYVNA